MGKSLPAMVVVLALAVAGCGSDSPEHLAGQSGEPPQAPATVTTTTEVPAPPATLVEQVVEIPAYDDLGLEWDEEPVVDEVTGAANMGPFNQYLIDSAPDAMMPEGTFDDLEDDEREAAVEAALALAPRKAAALFLGLDPAGVDPADLSVQMLEGDTGGPEGRRIIVILTDLEDDSVAAIRWEFRIQMQDKAGLVIAEQETTEAEQGQEGEASEEESPDTVEVTPEGVEQETQTTEAAKPPPFYLSVVYSGERTFQCMPGRGHLDFTAELCA